MNIKLKIVYLFVLITLIMSSCGIKKGFDSLNVYNYFDAKQKFDRLENRKTVVSSYGLSVIYQRKDNPFHNLDSALVKINVAYSNYSQLSDRKQEKYQKYGVDSLSILKQRSLISSLYFDRAIEANSVYGFQDFITKNVWSPDVAEAIILRDSLFFFENHEKGRSNNYELFMDTYPSSIYYTQADELYDKTLFNEITFNKGIEDYTNYLKAKPNGNFVGEAENSIFILSTPNKSIIEYKQFIFNYPQNRNVNSAWMLLYDVYMQNEYSVNSIENFIIEFPEFPFKKKIKEELLIANVQFYKYKSNNKWGFVSEDGIYSIHPDYEFVEPFSEGLAVVNSQGKIGYITKTGDLKIAHQFDDGFSFENGFAMVEVNGLFGLINRSGEFIVNPIYDDLGTVNEGLFYFEINEKIGFINSKGEEVISPQFSNATNFKNNFSIVEKEGKYGVIDTVGLTAIGFKYEAIKMINENQFIAKNDSLWGVINNLNDTIVLFEFDYIGMDIDSVLLVEKGNQFNYWNLSNRELISKDWFENYSEHRALALFVNGFAKVKTVKGYNFINKKSEFVFKTFYNNLGMYSNYVGFETSKGWGYLNKEEKVIVKPNYTKSNSFSKSAGVVELDDKKGLVDEGGEIILPIYFEEVYQLNDTLTIVKKNNVYGILSNFKDTVISIIYNKIEPISDSIVKISTDTKLTYYNFVTHTWLKKEEE